MTSATITATASAIPSFTPAGSAQPAPLENLMDTLHRTGHFKYLIKAITATGLTSPFQASGPHTVFAPNDYAFGRLAIEVLTDLFKPEAKARLTAILRLHLVPRRVTAAVSGSGSNLLKSLQGEDLAMNTTQGLRVNEARIVESDVQASNGVIHVIDTVLMPAAG
ncbi:fasciclin domain-containing protein [Roseateles sp. NT4]|uniref:fasciclin domain-containing protein n=1 Tax=Roseateles sp. NT4 TaxID=3453715 RepID=UPI003EECCB0D